METALHSVASGGGQVSSTLSQRFNGAEQAGRLICGSQTAAGGGADDNDATQSHLVAQPLKSQGMRGFNTDTFPYVATAEIAPTMNCHLGDKQGLENQHIDSGGGYFVASPVPDNQQQVVKGNRRPSR